METALWLVLVSWFLWSIWNWVRSRRPPSVEQVWELGNRNRDRVLEYSYLIDDYLHDEREGVRAMETDSIRLRERFKHDAAKQRQIAEDWCNYANALREVKSARELLDVDSEDDAFDRHDDRTKDSHITIQEIGKRVMDALGEQSHLKVFLAEMEAENAAELTLEQKMQRNEARRRKRPDKA